MPNNRKGTSKIPKENKNINDSSQLKERKSSAGRKPWDVILMFRSLVLARIINHIDLLLFAALVGFGWYVLVCGPLGIGHEPAVAAGLSGALFSGSALLLGNWINRANDRFKAEQEQAGQAEKIKVMIAAELVDVACGLMSAKELVDAGIISAQAGGQGMVNLDMSPYRPLKLPFADNLGTKLLVLENGAIDSIATLRSNLAATRRSMDEVTVSARLGLLKANSLSNGLWATT